MHISDLQRPGILFVGHPETTVVTVSLPAAERAHEEVATEAAAAAAAAALPGEGAAEEGKPGKPEKGGKPDKAERGGKPEKAEKGGKGGTEKGAS